MKITSRFTIAIQTMLVIACFSKDKKVTSTFLAESVNTNPVIIRKILGQLKAAKLIEIRPGVGGSTISKPLENITLLDIFKAVGAAEDHFFNFHKHPNDACPVGKNIHTVLDWHLEEIQEAMNVQMAKTTLAELLEDTKPYL